MKLSDLLEHSAPPQLMTLAKEFKKEFDSEKGKDEWGAPMSTVQDEAGSCAMVSETFLKWLKEKGVRAKFVTGHEAIDPKWKLDAEDAHTAIQVNQHVIDFTARQFNKSLPNPRIITTDEFKKEWKHVE